MALELEGKKQATGIFNLFSHSRRVEVGGGKERVGQTSYIVSLDGTGDFDDINEAIAAQSVTGGSIFIKKGTYILKSPISLQTDLHMTGESRNTVVVQYLEQGYMFTQNDKNLTLKSISFQGDNSNGSNRFIKVNGGSSTRKMYLNDVRIYEFGSHVFFQDSNTDGVIFISDSNLTCDGGSLFMLNRETTNNLRLFVTGSWLTSDGSNVVMMHLDNDHSYFVNCFIQGGYTDDDSTVVIDLDGEYVSFIGCLFFYEGEDTTTKPVMVDASGVTQSFGLVGCTFQGTQQEPDSMVTYPADHDDYIVGHNRLKLSGAAGGITKEHDGFTALNDIDMNNKALSNVSNNTLDWLSNVAALTEAQGDILYYDGSNWNRLAAGTSGYFLKTQGAGANPTWSAGASGTTAVLMSTNFGNNVSTYDTRYMMPMGGIIQQSTEANVLMVVPRAGTIKNMYVSLGSNGMDANTVFKTRVNSADSGCTVTLGSGVTSGSDTSNTASVSAGDLLSISMNTSASSSGTLSDVRVGIEYDS